MKSSGPKDALLQTRLRIVEVLEFQLNYFKYLKMMLLKVLHSVCQQMWKTHQRPLERSVFILIPKKGNAKECTNYHTDTLISYELGYAQNLPG